ncbi:helix-turn-helix domain-containing protein [Streptosporangium sp. NPDC051022]|uniref:IclR family transcriptional regulator n=1 Tax=Streptosporangium sp. NPDC051022 TaxID=3155752 RepID=UPI00342B8DE1
MTEISKTADQALAILTAVVEHGPIGAQDLSRELGCNRTVAHRLLATLHRRGFVRKQGSRYTVGPYLLRLVHQAGPAMLARARPVLRDLAAQHGETFLLTVADGDDAVAVDQAIGDRHPVRIQLSIGDRHPLTVGASGRAILAFSGDKQVTRALAAHDDPARLGEILAVVKELGYAQSHDELNANVSGISVPIFEEDGLALASLTALLPADRADKAVALVPELRSAARLVESLLRG